MSTYAGSLRFGRDSPSRIAGTATLLQESNELLPGEPMYQTLIPFYPAPSTSTTTSSPFVVEDGRQVWQVNPAACDLVLWQGDDVIITLYFRDNTDPTLDMSDDEGLTWTGQIRQSRIYTSTLIAEMTCVATYVPPTAGVYGMTKVEMFLPRQSNTYSGCFYWELRSLNDADLTRFPKPDDVDAADWPPDSLLRTWLYGACYILPRVGDTDFLLTGQIPALPLPPVGGYVMIPFVGPNGRVP